jgi:uncharacterized lipoprotein YddW (UPF0748 family)
MGMRLIRLGSHLALAGVAFIAACSGSAAVTEPAPVIPVTPVDTGPPTIQREMRGLWVATVANIDWPSRNNLTADVQRAELIDILDRAAASGFNAIVFHIRPACDAVYRSTIEPWGYMLSGTQGTDPGYDPLELAVQEAHARGMELHAWINPFRAGNSSDTLNAARLSRAHMFYTQRSLVRGYGSQLWLDPGEPAVHDHVMRVVSDIVQRYDIDAIHADDYFYPYQETDAQNRIIDFPDSGSYARSGSTLTRADWRRNNVDRFVERMYREVHLLKPSLRVGLSPFGIWRPQNPPGVTGLDAYATIYADSKKWLQQGWVDYLAPQLYWAIGSTGQSYPALLDWWISQSTMGRHVWPGLAAYRVADGTTSAFSSTEIPDQIKLTRTRAAGTGHLLYNTNTTLKRAGGATASAVAQLYKGPAILPTSAWLDAAAPAAPTIAVGLLSVQIWTTRIYFGDRRTVAVDPGTDRVLVNAVDRVGNVSATTEWVGP